MTLKQIEAFYWAATLASFSLAAERLCLSQSSLSKRLGELETHLGKALFDRSGHRAVLTTAGQTLLPQARKLLRAADEVRETMSDGVAVRGVCRFGLGELSALTWLPRFVGRARERFPALLLEPHVDMGRALEERVEGGELDFAVVAGTTTRAALSSRVVREVRYQLAGTPSLLGARRSVTAELLAEVALITMPGDAGSARELDNWLQLQDLEVDRRLRCNNLSAIAAMMLAGVGVAFLPEGWLLPLAARGDIVLLESRAALPTLSYSFQARRDDIRPMVEQVRRLVAEEADFTLANRLL